MKFLVCLTVLLFADVLLASPLTNRVIVNEHEVDIIAPDHRWTLVPDADGRMHLMDLNPIDVQIEPFFNAVEQVFFVLFTRKNSNGVKIGMNANEIKATTYNPANPTRFIIHGWNNDQNAAVNKLITAAYLARGDFNVIVVDWGAGANTVNYISARNRINEVGPVVATLIDFMHENGLIAFNRVNLVGHSLGGQTAGIVGKKVTRGRIQTIFALDPAGPLFHMNSPDERVTPTDAAYVEVIHTNGGTLGFGEPIGQADFYPNYGTGQPGCGADLTGSCAHSRSYEYFAESLKSDFTAIKCASYNEIKNKKCTNNGSARMGGDPGNAGTSGIFFLETNKASPFSRG